MIKQHWKHSLQCSLPIIMRYLDDQNQFIGIILCRGQKQRTVEYALRDTRKPMGVATYRAANELPEEYGEVLGGLEGLKELM